MLAQSWVNLTVNFGGSEIQECGKRKKLRRVEALYIQSAGIPNTGISSDTTSISSHAGQRGSIARATRLTLSQSIASTSSSCVVSSANTISSLALRILWMGRAL